MQSVADYVGTHRKQTVQIVIAILVVAAAATAIYFWMDHNSQVRQEKLAEALAVTEAPVGPSTQPNVVSYPTQAAKDAAEQKAFSDIAAQYGGTRQGAFAEYALAGMAADNGKQAEARKRYEQVAASGEKEYASLANFALAQLDFAEGKPADGEKRLRDLMAHPTAMVSNAQACLALAHHLSKSKPAEALQLLTPLLTEQGQVGQLAVQARAEINQRK